MRTDTRHRLIEGFRFGLNIFKKYKKTKTMYNVILFFINTK